jgi:hypothetical protein
VFDLGNVCLSKIQLALVFVESSFDRMNGIKHKFKADFEITETV